MTVDVLFFASARDLVGTSGTRVTLPDGSDVGDLLRHLVEAHPVLRPVVSSARFARNEEFVGLDTVLQTGDQVAWLPPMSGG